MKKIILLLALLPFLAFAQQRDIKSFRISAGQFPTRADWSCPGNSIFSQTFGFQYLYEADIDGNDIIYDNYSVSGGFNVVTFWGAILDINGNCEENPANMRIGFYEDDNNIPGALVATFDLAVPGEYVAEGYGIIVYMYTAYLGTTISLTDGWISVQGLSSGNGCEFYWCDSYDGDIRSYYTIYGVESGVIEGDFAYCLSMNSEVPISNWAVIAGLILITSLAVWRLRKTV
jgi:hypothetical protein